MGYIFCFRIHAFAGHRQTVRNLAAKASRCTSTSGDFVRWESSSEGSNCRFTSLAAKALIAAANSIENSIETLITISIRFTLYYFSAWFALIVVLNRTTPATARAPNIARLAKNLGIDRNEQGANSVCVASAEPNVLDAANAAARPTKAL